MNVAGRRSVVIHGHFYQPPREDPWLELVEREEGAAPYHDWNVRIERECYRAVLAARVAGPEGGIRSIVNTLEWISFNVGPTLLEWMEREAPATYRGILAADRASAARLGGHGNAIAMPYHHVILPLASSREKVTEIRWGITDFRRRFGREPTGMWLPETGLDDDTLDALAGEGIAFTIVAPTQVSPVPPAGRPGLYRTGSGRSITLFPYDGQLSHDIAFGPLIKDGPAWAAAIRSVPFPDSGPLLRSMATDGETYGHHHRFGEMALAATLEALRHDPESRLENFASYLARHPATDPVTVVQPSSWSCSHGVERWRSNCGCRMKPGTSQAWRGPLRAALEWLSEELHAIYGTEAARYFVDHWTARTTYGLIGAPSDLEQRARELVELERNAVRMFTSCGWFFDDLAGIETRQVLKYAARAIDLSGPHRARLEEGVLARLGRAIGNDPSLGTGADLYRATARPAWAPEVRVAAGFAATAALCPGHSRHVIGAYLVGALGENMLQTQHRRTGHTERFATSVHRAAGFAIEVDLTRSGAGAPVTVGLEALPERERDLVRDVLRREALREVFTAEELVRLAHGSAAYPETLRTAVTRLVPDRPADATAEALGRLTKALDLLALEDLTVPFDAQTRFYRLMTALNGVAAHRLRTLAARLGFDRGAFPTASPG
jgi:hypothetical protein